MPVQLSIVAILIFLSGLWSAYEVIVSLVSGKVNLNFGVLAMFVGIGLLNHREWARKWGRMIAWFLIIVSIILLISVLSGKASVTISGNPVSHDLYYPVGLSGSIGLTLIGLWMDWILRHYHTRTLMK